VFDPLKSGLVSTNAGDIPFYTNGSNPQTISLNAGESQNVTWWVNATGDIGTEHEFYVYANLSSDPSVSNKTAIINITIVDDITPEEGDCNCPGLNNDWTIDMGDLCNTTANCDIGTGYVHFIGSSGYWNISAQVDASYIEVPPSLTTIWITSTGILNLG
jgi:hypothetical protein